MTYEVLILRRAQRELASLSGDAYDSVREAIGQNAGAPLASE